MTANTKHIVHLVYLNIFFHQIIPNVWLFSVLKYILFIIIIFRFSLQIKVSVALLLSTILKSDQMFFSIIKPKTKKKNTNDPTLKYYVNWNDRTFKHVHITVKGIVTITFRGFNFQGLQCISNLSVGHKTISINTNSRLFAM